MTAETATILGAIIQSAVVILVAITGAAVSHYVTKSRFQRRKVIEYSVSSTSLLESKAMLKSPLLVSIDKSIFTHQPGDRGVPISIHNAYAFIIALRNVGGD